MNAIPRQPAADHQRRSELVHQAKAGAPETLPMLMKPHNRRQERAPSAVRGAARPRRRRIERAQEAGGIGQS